MFTGIIEELGTIVSNTRKRDDKIIQVKAPKVTGDSKIGDSVAVNGVCLTINEIHGKTLSTSIMSSTLNGTNLGQLKRGDLVNLERALRLKDRLGGHIVYGHVDGIATLTVKRMGYLEVAIPIELTRFVVDKGSIALDGISLTIQSIDKNLIRIGITPFTMENTNIRNWRIGRKINLETDILLKWFVSMCRQT